MIGWLTKDSWKAGASMGTIGGGERRVNEMEELVRSRVENCDWLLVDADKYSTGNFVREVAWKRIFLSYA
jgi:hypothetical protein